MDENINQQQHKMVQSQHKKIQDNEQAADKAGNIVQPQQQQHCSQKHKQSKNDKKSKDSVGLLIQKVDSQPENENELAEDDLSKLQQQNKMVSKPSDSQNNKMMYSVGYRDNLELSSSGLDSNIKKMSQILNKNYQLRTGSQNAFITDFIKQNYRLTKLSQDVSFDFVKNMMKMAQIADISPGKKIFNQAQFINEIALVLSGKVVVTGQMESQQNFLKMDEDLIFEKLINLSNGYARESKKKASQILSNNESKVNEHKIDESSSESNNFFLNGSQQIVSFYSSNQFLGLQDRTIGEVFIEDYYCEANQPTVLIKFNEKNLMISLQQAYKDKIKDLFMKLKNIACFSFLENDKINQIISVLTLKKVKKFTYIYQQGQPTTSFFFLKNGEVKMTKQTSILEENPNALYYDRQKLVEESLKQQYQSPDKTQQLAINKIIKKSVLPYANLSKMYNFQPNKKIVDIGVVTPFCMFGEEEYLNVHERDTNAQCISIDCEYYELNIRKLQQILGSKILSFFKNQLRVCLNKKILYRQSQYASTVTLHNKSSMDYFYLQNDGKQKESPRKFRITKMNGFVDNSSREQNKNKPQNNPPFYTSLNFNKLLREQKSKKKQSEHGGTPKAQYTLDTDFKYDTNEMNIMNISHTWKLMQKKVRQQVQTSRKISPQKPIINLNKPLIEAEYFYHIDKEKKRIERQYRKRVLSLGKSIKDRKSPSNSGKKSLAGKRSHEMVQHSSSVRKSP